MVTGPSLLRMRFQSELEAVRGLFQKAARGLFQKAARLLDVNGGAAATAAAAPTNAGKKKGKLAAEPAPAAAAAAGAKRMKTNHVEVEVIEPRMSKGERAHLVATLSSLSPDLPSHILDFMRRNCGALIDGDEMEINLDSAGDASLFHLMKLIDAFAVESKKPRKDAAAAMSEDEFVDICGDGASPVVAEEKLPETGGHRAMKPAAAAATPQQKKLGRAAGPIGDLIAKAQQKKQRCLVDVERKKAREELLKVKRTVVPVNTMDPKEMARLHLAEVEHVVSSGDMITPVRLLGLVMKK